MLDWLWKGITAIAGLVALVFGINAACAKQRMEQEEYGRKVAIDRMVDACIMQLKTNLDRIKKRSFEGAPES